MAPTAVQKYIAEFIGTYLLVFTVGCNVLTSPDKTAANWAATSIACVLMVAIYALGGVSGGNFNPAVSLTLGLTKNMEFGEVAIYTVVQVVAGILAGLSFHGCFDHPTQKPFLLGPGAGFNWFDTMIVEALYTCMLCFVVLNVALSKKNTPNEFFALAIGFVIVAGGYAAGGISGGAFNPAVAIGIEVSSGNFAWCYLYLIYEYIGACVAAGLFMAIRPNVSDSEEYSLPQMLLAELIGTFYLCLTVGLCVLGKSPVTAWAAAAALMCMIFSLGNVSGANFNPAVTLALVLRGEGIMPAAKAAQYAVVQLLGSIIAALVVKLVHAKDGTYHNGTYGFGPGHDAVHGWHPILVAELTYTFVLCFVVLCVCTTETPLKEFYGFAIGSCVTVGGFGIGSVSGGALNPAVSLGADLVHNLSHGGSVTDGFTFAGIELLGGALAAVAFRATHSIKEKGSA